MAFTSGRLWSGEKAGIGTSAVAVSTTSENIREVLLQSDPGNSTNMLVGSASDQEIVLTPGQSITIPIASLSLVFVKMASGVGVANWLSRD